MKKTFLIIGALVLATLAVILILYVSKRQPGAQDQQTIVNHPPQDFISGTVTKINKLDFTLKLSDGNEKTFSARDNTLVLRQILDKDLGQTMVGSTLSQIKIGSDVIFYLISAENGSKLDVTQILIK